MDLSQVDLSRKQLHYLRPERLENQPYIAYSVDQGLQRTASQLFERFSVRPRQVLEISNTSTARSLAQDNMGFILIPTNSVLTHKIKDNEVICCTITDPALVRPVIVSYKKGQVLSPAARCFIDTIKRVALSDSELQPHSFPVCHDLGD